MTKSVSSEVMHMQQRLYQAHQWRHVKCSSRTELAQMPCTGIRLKHCAKASTTSTHTDNWVIISKLLEELAHLAQPPCGSCRWAESSLVWRVFAWLQCTKWRRFDLHVKSLHRFTYPAMRHFDVATAPATCHHVAAVAAAAVGDAVAAEAFPCASTTWLSHFDWICKFACTGRHLNFALLADRSIVIALLAQSSAPP